MIPKHWHWLDLGYGVHTSGQGLAEFFQDVDELGERVALALEDEWIWTAHGIVILAAAPGGPWEGR